MKLSIGISENNLNKSIALLTTVLADEMTIYIKTRKFHWNVSGDSFMELHKLFQSQYIQLEETIDQVAERIGKLGGIAIGTMVEFSSNARLKEKPYTNPKQNQMLKELSNDYEKMIIELRKDIDKSQNIHKDVGTTDFLTGILEQHETTAWVIRRYLN